VCHAIVEQHGRPRSQADEEQGVLDRALMTELPEKNMCVTYGRYTTLMALYVHCKRMVLAAECNW
jgi:hypothetical protein